MLGPLLLLGCPKRQTKVNQMEKLLSHLRNFIRDDNGQDLIEYTILLAFVCVASSAFIVNSGHSVSGIWTATNSRLTAANTSAS
jgi:Flp pilus assembly pilin Flp